MSQNLHMKSENIKFIEGQVRDNTPLSIIDVIAIQMERINEAKRRIDEEGIVVRDMKGSIIQHPAIKIESDASKLMADLLTKNKKF